MGSSVSIMKPKNIENITKSHESNHDNSCKTEKKGSDITLRYISHDHIDSKYKSEPKTMPTSTDTLIKDNHIEDDINQPNNIRNKYFQINQSYESENEIHDSDNKDENNEENDEDNDDDDNDEYVNQSAEMFTNTAMSLGMDNDELLFNLLYFGGESSSHCTFGNMINSALEETVALHSQDNTPYKLNPASNDDLSHLKVQILKYELNKDISECPVCKDQIEVGENYIQLQQCEHCFHADCIYKWLNLVRISI